MKDYKTLKSISHIDIKGNALDIFMRRYALKGKTGKPKEKLEEAFYRVASFIAGGEKTKNLKNKYTKYFYSLLGSRRFIPNTPTWSGAKTPLGQLAACFVLPLEDEMGRDTGGIFQTLRDAALIQQVGGGNGFSFSRLRPKGDRVSSSNGVASGPLSFMEIYDIAFGKIAQGGTRRGANMAVLRVDHPDIMDFIRCKSGEGSISNFNISVGITDEFMKAVKGDKDFNLINPHDKKVWKTVSARKIFNEIVKYAHKNGEPGLLFLDTANKFNPVPNQYTLEATNPCVTGDTLIYTSDGLRRADILENSGRAVNVVVDGRFNVGSIQAATSVFCTGEKEVYKLTTYEGYEVKLTCNHKIMSNRGWVQVGDLSKGDKIHVLNREGGFGDTGSRELGLVLGWLIGDGTISNIRAVLSFFNQEKKEIAPIMSKAVSLLVNNSRYTTSAKGYIPVGVTELPERDESRIQSDRLLLLARECGLDKNKLQVPTPIFSGNREAQQAFLQALFTADGTVNSSRDKGCSVRLTSVSLGLLKSVQRLLINFGIASRIYERRRSSSYRKLPNKKSGYSYYYCSTCHELAVSKQNLLVFTRNIGFLSQVKNLKLNDYINYCSKRGLYRENYLARVKSVEYVGKEKVYDLIQKDTSSFIANGFVVHNCGEQWLGPFENCCLGHVNINESVSEDGKINWEHLRESVVLGTRFLDNVVTQNNYVPSVPQLKGSALKNRRIGLGFMGLADAFYKMGIRYGGEKSLDLASQITEFIRFHSMKTSIDLAKERGPFPGISGSIYDPKKLKWKILKPLFKHKENFRRPLLKWGEIKTSLKKYGIRNSTQLTVAPTGTTSTVFGIEGYGCEPVFALAYSRNVYQSAGGEENLKLAYVSPSFQKALNESSLRKKEKEEIIKEAIEKGTIQHVKNLPAKIKNTFVVSSDITSDEHVLIQAAIQKFVDNSISKTCNFPSNATVEDVEKVYFKAWELGCKGLTVYVTGSRKEVVLETKETADKKQDFLVGIEESDIRPRPAVVIGRTHKVSTPVGKAFITVNRNGETGTKPFEVFINIGKSGSDLSSMAEALGRLVSGWLRSAKDPNKALEEVQIQLRGIGGSMSVGFGPNRVTSLPDAVAKVLGKEIELSQRLSDTKVLNDGVENFVISQEENNVEVAVQPSLFKGASICPECNNMSLVETEGCIKCYLCSYTRC